MRLVNSLSVFVVAFAVGHTVTDAAEQSPSRNLRVTRITPVAAKSQAPVPAPVPLESLDFSFDGFKPWQAVPEYGVPGSAAAGAEHFPLPMHHYTHWYRPRAATLTAARRCEAQPFRPRGFGNLFARPCDCFRMEYRPYSLSDDRSLYGPVYIARQPDPRCEHCDEHGHLASH